MSAATARRPRTTAPPAAAARTPDPPPEFVGSPYQRTAGHGLPGVFVPTRALAGSAARAEPLAQLAYWFGEAKTGLLRAKVNRGGRWWVDKTFRRLGGRSC